MKMLRQFFVTGFVLCSLMCGCSQSPDTITDTKILGTWNSTDEHGANDYYFKRKSYFTRTFSPHGHFQQQYRSLSATIEKVGTWELSGSVLTIDCDMTKFVMEGIDRLPNQLDEEKHSETTETVVSVSELTMATINENRETLTWTR